MGLKSLHVGAFDIVQYDCPVVQLTENVRDSKIIVVGANVTEIERGLERIYVVIFGDEHVLGRSMSKLGSIRNVKSYEIIQRRKNQIKLRMLIEKTSTMEAAVNYDAVPLTAWIAMDGFERWTLGFHTSRDLREFMKRVSEVDYIEKYRLAEISELTLSQVNYVDMLFFVSGGLNKLTDKQIKLLSTALELGYYDWPRRAGIAEIARKHGISRIAAAKTLRRAERNLVSLSLSTFDGFSHSRPRISNTSKHAKRS